MDCEHYSHVRAADCLLELQESAVEVVTSAGDMSSINCDLSDWESVVMEHEHWTVLVRQLEDLLAVQSLLLMRPAPDSISKPPWEPETLSITLKRVLDGGKGESVCKAAGVMTLSLILVTTGALKSVIRLTMLHCYCLIDF